MNGPLALVYRVLLDIIGGKEGKTGDSRPAEGDKQARTKGNFSSSEEE